MRFSIEQMQVSSTSSVLSNILFIIIYLFIIYGMINEPFPETFPGM